jgi:hypothetical protein
MIMLRSNASHAYDLFVLICHHLQAHPLLRPIDHRVDHVFAADGSVEALEVVGHCDPLSPRVRQRDAHHGPVCPGMLGLVHVLYRDLLPSCDVSEYEVDMLVETLNHHGSNGIVVAMSKIYRKTMESSLSTR